MVWLFLDDSHVARCSFLKEWNALHTFMLSWLIDCLNHHALNSKINSFTFSDVWFAEVWEWRRWCKFGSEFLLQVCKIRSFLFFHLTLLEWAVNLLNSLACLWSYCLVNHLKDLLSNNDLVNVRYSVRLIYICLEMLIINWIKSILVSERSLEGLQIWTESTLKLFCLVE